MTHTHLPHLIVALLVHVPPHHHAPHVLLIAAAVVIRDYRCVLSPVSLSASKTITGAMLCCWWAQVQSVIWFSLLAIAPVAAAGLLIRLLFVAKRRHERKSGRQTVGFFHPYCNAGGGGERVLWAMVQVVQSKFPELDVVIYTGDVSVTPDQILGKVSQNLQMDLLREPRFVYLHHRNWVEANMFPYFTLLGQSVASLILGAEAVIRCTPDYLIDTMGYSFTYPLFKLMAGCRVACYTHYPTISSEMLEVVSSSSASFNNRHWIARSPFFTSCKLLYYRLFALAYALCGSFSDMIMVNSSWTRNHINSIWGLADRTHLLFPPCDTTAFQSLDLTKKQRFTIISVAQFRPEKDHKLQLTAFKRFTELVEHVTGSERSRLILVGSCRNQEDDERVSSLRLHAQELGLGDHQVEFRINIKFDELTDLVQQANAGIHSMRNEHFGISVVELMAGGAIVVAHDSGGPQMDIVRPGENGFLASSADEYAERMAHIVQLNETELRKIRIQARTDVSRFSDESFRQNVCSLLNNFFAVR